MPKKKINIYEYEDYRLFIADFVELKKQSGFFSQRLLAKKAGFGSHCYIPYLINGKRNLTVKSAGKLIAALELTPKEADYFRELVGYSREISPAKKDLHFQVMNRIRRNTQVFKLRKNQYAYLDKWYYPVIRELAVYSPWNGDYTTLAGLCFPPIKPREAEKAIKLLTALKLLKKLPDGSYEHYNPVLEIDALPTHLLKKARDSFIQLAIDASDKLGPDKRNIAGVTFTLSEANFRRLSQKLDHLYEEILQWAHNEHQPERVYQCNIQLFPVSEMIERKTAQGKKETPSD